MIGLIYMEEINRKLSQMPPEKRLANSLSTRFKSLYSKFSDITDVPERKKEFITNIKQRVKKLSEDKKDLGEIFELIIDNEKEKQFEKIEDWIDNISAKLSEKISENYSLADLEKKFYEFNIKLDNYPLNRMFTYKVENGGKDVSLHVPIIFVDNATEIKKLFIEAMQLLAEKFKKDDNLKNAETVIAKSSISYHHPELLEKAGFEITSRDENKKLAVATIAKDKFLEMYFKK